MTTGELMATRSTDDNGPSIADMIRHAPSSEARRTVMAEHILTSLGVGAIQLDTEHSVADPLHQQLGFPSEYGEGKDSVSMEALAEDVAEGLRAKGQVVKVKGAYMLPKDAPRRDRKEAARLSRGVMARVTSGNHGRARRWRR